MLKRIHLLPGLDYCSEREELGGFYDKDQYEIVIRINTNEEPALLFMWRVVHEFVHMHAFQSMSNHIKKRGLESRRQGLEIINRESGKDQHYFWYLDEAITEELTKIFCENHFIEIPELGKELNLREEYKKKLLKTKLDQARAEILPMILNKEKLDEIIADVNETVGIVNEKLINYAYVAERKLLHKIINAAWVKRENIRKKYKSKIALFDVFARAAMTGRLKELARVFEELGGRGTFRKFGERTGKNF